MPRHHPVDPTGGEPDDDPGEEPEDEGTADIEAAVSCPYCGAPNEIALDPSGGREQEYIEDCQVCCQPWSVHIRYRRDGTADVRLDATDGG